MRQPSLPPAHHIPIQPDALDRVPLSASKWHAVVQSNSCTLSPEVPQAVCQHFVVLFRRPGSSAAAAGPLIVPAAPNLSLLRPLHPLPLLLLPALQRCQQPLLPPPMQTPPVLLPPALQHTDGEFLVAHHLATVSGYEDRETGVKVKPGMRACTQGGKPGQVRVC